MEQEGGLAPLPNEILLIGRLFKKPAGRPKLDQSSSSVEADKSHVREKMKMAPLARTNGVLDAHWSAWEGLSKRRVGMCFVPSCGSGGGGAVGDLSLPVGPSILPSRS